MISTIHSEVAGGEVGQRSDGVFVDDGGDSGPARPSCQKGRDNPSDDRRDDARDDRRDDAHGNPRDNRRDKTRDDRMGRLMRRVGAEGQSVSSVERFRSVPPAKGRGRSGFVWLEKR